MGNSDGIQVAVEKFAKDNAEWCAVNGGATTAPEIEGMYRWVKDWASLSSLPVSDCTFQVIAQNERDTSGLLDKYNGCIFDGLRIVEVNEDPFPQAWDLDAV